MSSSGSKEEKQGREPAERAEQTSVHRGRPTGARNYTRHENTVLLDCVQTEMPLSREEWGGLAAKHKQAHGGMQTLQLTSPKIEFACAFLVQFDDGEGREAENLKKHFRQLVNGRKQTGEGEMDQINERAMILDCAIRDKAEAVDEGVDDAPEVVQEDDEEEDEAYQEEDDVEVVERKRRPASANGVPSAAVPANKEKKAVMVSAGPMVFTPSAKKALPAKRKPDSGSSSSQMASKKAKVSVSKKSSTGQQFFTLAPKRPRALQATQRRRHLDSILGELAFSIRAAAEPPAEDSGTNDAVQQVVEAQLAQQHQLDSLRRDLGEIAQSLRAITRQLASPSPAAAASHRSSPLSAGGAGSGASNSSGSAAGSPSPTLNLPSATP